MKKKHVLFLHSYYSTADSTTGSRSHDLCKALIAAGFKVTVVCQVVDLNRAAFKGVPGRIKQLEIDGVSIFAIDVFYSNKMGILQRLGSFFKFMFLSTIKCFSIKEIDVVFATSTPPTIAVPALSVKFLRRVPFIFELRDIWPDFVEQLDVLPNVPKWVFRAVDRGMRIIYSLADYITTTTPGMTSIIQSKGVAENKLGTMLLGANRHLFEGQHVPHPVLDHDRLKGKFIVAFLGSISYGYGLIHLLRVAERMKKVNPNVGFLIIGRGNDYNRLSDYIREKKLTNVYLGEAIQYSDVPRVLKFVDVGYESSLPSPASDCALDNKFYDYISAGIPILSNYDGDMGHLLREYECGIVSENIDHEIDIIDSLERDRKKVSKMAGNAKVLAGKFNRDTQSKIFVEMIKKFV